MSLEEVDAAVTAEGLTLVQSSFNLTGFKGVSIKGKRWTARLEGAYLGAFGSAAEAALAYARELGPQGSAAAAAKVR